MAPSQRCAVRCARAPALAVHAEEAEEDGGGRVSPLGVEAFPGGVAGNSTSFAFSFFLMKLPSNLRQRCNLQRKLIQRCLFGSGLHMGCDMGRGSQIVSNLVGAKPDQRFL